MSYKEAMIAALDATETALAAVALDALDALSDKEVYALPQPLQSAELKRRIVAMARKCEDEKVLEAVIKKLKGVG